MNNFKQILVIALAIILTLPACRKGEDDPGLSLRSRDARLAGEWIINDNNHNFVSHKISEDFATGTRVDTTSTTETNFDGTHFRTFMQVMTKGELVWLNLSMDSTQYHYSLLIDESGQFTISKSGITTEQLEVEEIYSGNWSWGNADKKKVLLHLNFQGNVHSYYVRELRKDVLKLEREWVEYYETESYDPQAGKIYTNMITVSHEENFSLDKVE